MDLSPVSKFGLPASQVAANATVGSSTHSLSVVFYFGAFVPPDRQTESARAGGWGVCYLQLATRVTMSPFHPAPVWFKVTTEESSMYQVVNKVNLQKFIRIVITFRDESNDGN